MQYDRSISRYFDLFLAFSIVFSTTNVLNSAIKCDFYQIPVLQKSLRPHKCIAFMILLQSLKGQFRPPETPRRSLNIIFSHSRLAGTPPRITPTPIFFKYLRGVRFEGKPRKLFLAAMLLRGILMLARGSPQYAQSVPLAWNASNGPNLPGYRLHDDSAPSATWM
jgi:hypothetical protein